MMVKSKLLKNINKNINDCYVFLLLITFKILLFLDLSNSYVDKNNFFFLFLMNLKIYIVDQCVKNWMRLIGSLSIRPDQLIKLKDFYLLSN